MRKMTVDAFLTWAFTKELCKIGSGSGHGGAAIASSWGAMSEFVALGTLIDRSPNGYGVIPDFIEDGDPHPDALRAGEAVRQLVNVALDIPEDWAPFPEWPDERGLIAAEVSMVRQEMMAKGGRLSGRHVAALVTTCAILGRGPDWQATRPREAMVLGPNGSPRWFCQRSSKDVFGNVYTIETDGYNRRTNKPMRGAYRKYRLISSVRGAILDRMEWQQWQSALTLVADQVAGDLQAFEIVPFEADLEPWARYEQMQKCA